MEDVGSEESDVERKLDKWDRKAANPVSCSSPVLLETVDDGPTCALPIVSVGDPLVLSSLRSGRIGGACPSAPVGVLDLEPEVADAEEVLCLFFLAESACRSLACFSACRASSSSSSCCCRVSSSVSRRVCNVPRYIGWLAVWTRGDVKNKSVPGHMLR